MNQCNSLSTLLPSSLRVNARYVHQLYEAPTSLCHRLLFPLTSKGAIPNFDSYSSSTLFNSILPFFFLSFIRSRGLISTRINKHSIARFGSFILSNHMEIGLGCWCSGFFFSLPFDYFAHGYSLTHQSAWQSLSPYHTRVRSAIFNIPLISITKGILTIRYLSTGGLACLFIL